MIKMANGSVVVTLRAELDPGEEKKPLPERR